MTDGTLERCEAGSLGGARGRGAATTESMAYVGRYFCQGRLPSQPTRGLRRVEHRAHLGVPRVHEDVDARSCIGADQVREVAGGEQAHEPGASVATE